MITSTLPRIVRGKFSAFSFTRARWASTSSTPAQSIFMRLGPLTRVAQSYSRAQRSRPIVTQLIGSFVIYTLSDLSAQNIDGKEYDPARTGRNILIGLIAAIPYYKWFMFLSRNFNYASTTLSVAAKVAVNQLFFASSFSVYFFSMQALLAGEGIDAAIERVKTAVPVSYANSFKVWPATVAVSMAFLPIEFRAIFGGVVAVGWQTYLCFLNKRAEMEREAEGGQESAVLATA